MAIVATDLKFYISGGSVGAGNTDPAYSLGGVITTTEVGTNLFDNISSAEAAAGEDEYRAFFVKNTNATDTAYNVKFWISTNTPSTSTEMQGAVCDTSPVSLPQFAARASRRGSTSSTGAAP